MAGKRSRAMLVDCFGIVLDVKVKDCVRCPESELKIPLSSTCDVSTEPSLICHAFDVKTKTLSTL
jgi:hypothetical protein